VRVHRADLLDDGKEIIDLGQRLGLFVGLEFQPGQMGDALDVGGGQGHGTANEANPQERLRDDVGKQKGFCIDPSECQQGCREKASHQGLQRPTKLKQAQGEQQTGGDLYEGIAPSNAAFAMTTASEGAEIRQHRDEFVPMQAVLTKRAMRGGCTEAQARFCA